MARVPGRQGDPAGQGGPKLSPFAGRPHIDCCGCVGDVLCCSLNKNGVFPKGVGFDWVCNAMAACEHYTREPARGAPHARACRSGFWPTAQGAGASRILGLDVSGLYLRTGRMGLFVLSCGWGAVATAIYEAGVTGSTRLGVGCQHGQLSPTGHARGPAPWPGTWEGGRTRLARGPRRAGAAGRA
jgi:hypothetical protein